MIRQAIYIATAFIVTVVYWGLAFYVVTRSPRRTISWVFFAFGFASASHYVSSLFLYPHPGVSADVTPFALRWKWASGAFGFSFYLHLLTFYFPISYRRHRIWWLGLAYLASTSLAITALFTDLLVAGPLYRPAPHTIGAVPGPLMPLYAGVHIVVTILAVVGLFVGFLKAPSSSVRRQIRSVSLPTGLLIASSAVNWGITLTQNADFIPHEIGDLFVVVAGCLYARSVLRYGSLVGRPLDIRGHLYSIAGAAGALVALYLSIKLDYELASHLPYPLPVATSLLLLVVAAGYPALRRWLVKRLDRWFFKSEHRRRETVERLAGALFEASDPEQLTTELLRVICEELDVCGGYLALPTANSQVEGLVVQAIWGDIAMTKGDLVQKPTIQDLEPVLCTNLQEQQSSTWANATLFCPLPLGQGRTGVLALREKRDGRAFVYEELVFCREMVAQLGLVRRMVKLREARDGYIAAAQLRESELHDLDRRVETSVEQTVATFKQQAAMPAKASLEMHVLGPMQVMCGGRLISEKAWGTEKAKSMLAYLLWKGSIGATRDEIVECLWPNQPIEKAANVFHVTMHRLRRALEPGLHRVRHSRYILHEGGRYRFNFDAPHWLDVAAFNSLAASDDAIALREAVALYRGGYLEGASADLPSEIGIEQQSLERLYVDAMRRLIAQLDQREVIPFLERLLIVEPAEETAQCALVTGYLAQGRYDLAYRQVARWRETLIELGLEPSPEARALWWRVESATGSTC